MTAKAHSQAPPERSPDQDFIQTEFGSEAHMSDLWSSQNRARILLVNDENQIHNPIYTPRTKGMRC
jgi:hypothetical protein